MLILKTSIVLNQAHGKHIPHQTRYLNFAIKVVSITLLLIDYLLSSSIHTSLSNPFHSTHVHIICFSILKDQAKLFFHIYLVKSSCYTFFQVNLSFIPSSNKKPLLFFFLLSNILVQTTKSSTVITTIQPKLHSYLYIPL